MNTTYRCDVVAKHCIADLPNDFKSNLIFWSKFPNPNGIIKIQGIKKL